MLDLILLELSYLLAHWLYHGTAYYREAPLYRNVFFAIAAIDLVVGLMMGSYKGILRRGYWLETKAVAKHAIIVTVCVIAYMMRQAVPLLRSEAPIVGTGIERQLVRDSRTQIAAEGDGVIDFVDATTIRILYDRTEDEEFVSFEPALKEYRIPKFRKTNQNMTIDLRPTCNKGDRVTKGQILTEGYSTENGELALGKNLLVAYMPWKGYNYEDAIVLNERVVREDLLTSVHVEEYSLEVRETKRGMEELTSDIPNVSEEATKDLDENGIVRVGARIQPGDILIGKITPKGESDPSPEEKLLRAIFGDKAGDVKDASLKASPSLKGVIIDKKLFSRVIKNRSSKLADKALLPKIDDEFESKVADLKRILVKKLMVLTEGKVSQGVKDYLGAEVIA